MHLIFCMDMHFTHHSNVIVMMQHLLNDVIHIEFQRNEQKNRHFAMAADMIHNEINTR